MNVAIIENSEDPKICEFMTHPNGRRLLFDNFEIAEDWLMRNSEPGVAYAKYDGDN